MERTIVIACDHAGYKTKLEIISWLEAKRYKILDVGTWSEESVDYPDYAHPLAEAVEEGEAECGISLCGSGNGINMAANKHQGIRSALCWNAEIARLARLHNDANVCAIPARFVNIEEALTIIEAFLSTDFEGGRHIARIEKIPLQ
jgi:ribose 5-phosphate isomerase B